MEKTIKLTLVGSPKRIEELRQELLDFVSKKCKSVEVLGESRKAFIE